MADGDKVIILEVKELLVNAQLKQGKYNAESYYGHVQVAPKEEMVVVVPVSELGTLQTIKDVVSSLGRAVTDGIKAQLAGEAVKGNGNGHDEEMVKSALIGVGQEQEEEF